MPPLKGKKALRPSPSASPSPSDRSPLSHSLSTPTRGAAAEEAEEEARLRALLPSATAKFPGLISEAAFAGRISDVDSSSQSKGGEARVWLSESAMVSASLLPGSLVTVSLATSDNIHPDNSPLEPFSDGIARRLGIPSVADQDNQIGSYFTVATVFPSRKVLKNGLRLSWCLSCIMGYPSLGRGVFVCPIEGICKKLTGNKKAKSATDMNFCDIFFCKCNDLLLKLIPVDDVLINNVEWAPAKVPQDTNNAITTNGMTSSPRTPLSSKPKFSSPSPSVLQSNASKDLVSNFEKLDVSAVRLALKDEKLNELLSIFAARWLNGQHLLNGNFVTLPICGKLCNFRVDSANGLLAEGSSEDLTYEGNHSSLSHDTPISSLESKIVVFIVDSKTKVNLIESMPASIVISERDNKLSEKTFGKDLMRNSRSSIPQLGGLSKEFAIVKEIIKFSLMPKDSLPRYKGVLLHGPPGTGKTSLACFCVHDAGAKLLSVNGPEIVSQYFGESEQALCEVFDSAKRAAPSVVFIDELDAIAPARKDGVEELSLRIVATLLTLMDDINDNDRVLLIAATNRPDSIDPALRRPGRFDREIEIGVPSPDQRLDILTTILNGKCHSLNEKDIHSLAQATHGFVGADLAALCNEAAMVALRRYINFKAGRDAMAEGSFIPKDNECSSNEELESISNSLSKLALSSNLFCLGRKMKPYISDTQATEDSVLRVSAEDFEKAKLKVRPSAMREVMLELPKVSWDDVGGQAEIKRQLIEAVQWPQICPDAFERIGIRPPRGLLMFGPPGCSKTLMARAVASEAKLNFLAVKGPELFSKWVGESEKAVKSLFAKARANSPSIIFFDEIDGLAVTRGQDNDGTSVGDRVLSQLLVELDGLDQRAGITVIAATNRPDKIDPALLRPGRFDRHLDVKPPNEADREAIFRIHMRGMPCSSDFTAKDLAHLTEGYTGADIKLICREAAIAALEESLEASEISLKHFQIGIGKVQPSDVQFYLSISDRFKRYVDTRQSI